MAGTVSDFNASEFRDAIKFAMQMGTPTSDDEKLVWHINSVKSYMPQDPALKPYDWEAEPTVDQPGDPDHPSGEVVVDCAIEFSASGGGESPAGRFDTSRLEVTLLDVDYEKIRSADYATIGRTHYEIKFVGPPMGMFDVTAYTVYLQARDQS